MQNVDRLCYFADPMCSWCYGFGPVLTGFLGQHPTLAVEVVMGGLRPYTKDAAPASQKAEIRNHWRHVEAASGLPFDDAMLMSAGFIYNTEPACRAVVTAREMKDDAIGLLKAIQCAFYRDARDVTDEEVLIAIAAENSIATKTFAEHLRSDVMRDATHRDFQLTAQLGVRGFPMLCAARGDQLHAITNGYAPQQVVDESFRALMVT
jgi:putative protein-disulfide isomerase